VPALPFCKITVALGLSVLGWAQAAQPPADEELAEVVVTAPEPRYVAPTTRDRIGRVWVPVEVDGKGPFRLVLDTGAQRSAVTQAMALRLGAPAGHSPQVLVHGVTGTAVASTIAVGSLQVGDLQLQPSNMPIVADVFGGAEGLLGIEGLQGQRIFIDFRHDIISIAPSRNHSAPAGFGAIRVLPDPAHLLVVQARVGNVPVRAIIDTGAQSTVGNLALQAALRRQLAHGRPPAADRVQGATGEWQSGVGVNLSPIQLGELTVRDAWVTFAPLHIFDHWQLREEPALLIGMDILGLVDELIIDYRRGELQIKPRGS